MTAAAEGLRAAPWLVRAYQELQRHRHLIVHGNVDDVVRWNNRYEPLAAVLGEFLTMTGYRAVGRYSLVDGITYRDEAMRGTAEPLTAAPVPPAPEPVPAQSSSRQAWNPFAAAPPAGAGREDAGRADRVARADESLQRAIRTAPPAQPRTTPDALGAIRRLMTQTEAPVAMVIDSADLIVGAAGQLDEHHRANVAHLRHMLTEAAVAPCGPGLRNVVVLVVRDLGELPAWLTERPDVAAVLAERPGPAERADVLAGQIGRFHRAVEAPAAVLHQAVATLANLTDGMTVRDIQTLEVTSRLTGIGPGAPRRLVARHRFGVRDDPWEQLDIDKVRQAEQMLGARVMGQPAAVRAVADVLVNARVGVDFVAGDAETGNRPKGVFFFVGPTGVGKTELAKAIAELVFDDESALRRFDMSEFSQEHASERLTGAPPGFVGHEQGGVLTNWVRERPFSVILFDEIEKAHRKVFDKFLQIIDDGRLTDGHGRTAYFSHSIVIFTSNQGAATLHRSHPGGVPPYQFVQEHFHQAVGRFFTEDLQRPELLGRLGSGVVVFDILREQVIRSITDKFLGQITASAAARGYELVFDAPAIHRAIVEHVMTSGAALGARPIRDPLLEQWIRVPLNRWIMANAPGPGTRILVHRTASSPPFGIQRYPGEIGEGEHP
ncbi:AAA family ATPase [Dactylosporangium sp. NPDC051485]|uniref:AAA family ATPase n=1 Tax=Dactylosporangium sp. NPDC051485 TaxID=3154846 RepID=UPI00341C4AE0